MLEIQIIEIRLINYKFDFETGVEEVTSANYETKRFAEVDFIKIREKTIVVFQSVETHHSRKEDSEVKRKPKQFKEDCNKNKPDQAINDNEFEA